MSVKVKLTSLITTFILLCSLLAVGVFAVKNTTFNVGGNIEFNVKGIEADINLTDTGTANLAVNNENPVMQPIEIRNTTTESEIVSAFSTWSNLDLAFSPNKSTATIELEISNKSTDANNYIGISASADALTKNNAEIIVTNNAGGQTALIGKDQTATFTITFKVVDDGYSAKLDNFVVKFDMKKLDTAELPTEGEVNSSITPSNDELTITKEDTTTKATQTLTETVSLTSQKSTYTYDIKNNSYTESIYLNPTATLSEEQTDVATTIYYSVEDNEISTFSTQSTEYKLLTEDYLVILPQKSVKVQVQMLPINVTSTKEVSLGVELNLHAEKPADFVQDYTYEIIDNEVYRTPICNTCECYPATEKMNADEYIIATPETAQSILDSNINGKTIVFDEGIYTDRLELRPSKATVSAIYKKGELYTGELNNSYKSYVYQRDYNDIIFAGVKEAIFKNYLIMTSGEIFTTHVLPDFVYDAVREITVTTPKTEVYNSVCSFENIVITGMKFEGKTGRIIIENNYGYSYNYKYNFDNININNCTFITKELDDSYPEINSRCAGIYMRNRNADRLSNVVIKNNYIDGHYQGISIWGAYNVSVLNNEVKNTMHNSIALQNSKNEPAGADELKFKGDFRVINNLITNATDRAIRFGVGQDAKIIIEGNNFNNCVDGNSLLKTQISTNTSYKFLNNIYAGNVLDNQKGTLNSTQWEVTV